MSPWCPKRAPYRAFQFADGAVVEVDEVGHVEVSRFELRVHQGKVETHQVASNRREPHDIGCPNDVSPVRRKLAAFEVVEVVDF